MEIQSSQKREDPLKLHLLMDCFRGKQMKGRWRIEHLIYGFYLNSYFYNKKIQVQEPYLRFIGYIDVVVSSQSPPVLRWPTLYSPTFRVASQNFKQMDQSIPSPLRLGCSKNTDSVKASGLWNSTRGRLWGWVLNQFIDITPQSAERRTEKDMGILYS